MEKKYANDPQIEIDVNVVSCDRRHSRGHQRQTTATRTNISRCLLVFVLQANKDPAEQQLHSLENAYIPNTSSPVDPKKAQTLNPKPTV